MMYTQANRFDEDDRKELPGKDAYKTYFHFMEAVFRQVVSTCSQNDSIKNDGMLLRPFAAKLLNSIECLRMRYLFDPHFTMKIDESDSSYPNAYEFSKLLNDTDERIERLSRLEGRDVLLDELLETIYGKTEDFSHVQLQLATRTYYEYLEKNEKLFLPFTKGGLESDSNTEAYERNSYICTWGVFEPTLSIPMVYELRFEVDENSSIGDEQSEAFQKLWKDLQFNSKNLTPLSDIARIIDASNNEIYPKEFRRLILGPLYGPYSTSDGKISEFLHEAGSENTFALEMQSEYLESVNEKKRAMKFATEDTKKVYQEFDVSQTSFDTMARQTTRYKQFLFVPHDVGQRMIDAGIEELKNYIIISLQKK